MHKKLKGGNNQLHHSTMIPWLACCRIHASIKYCKWVSLCVNIKYFCPQQNVAINYYVYQEIFWPLHWKYSFLFRALQCMHLTATGSCCFALNWANLTLGSTYRGFTLNTDYFDFKITCHFLCLYGVSMRLPVLFCSFHHHLRSGNVFKTPITCLVVINSMNTMFIVMYTRSYLGI